MLVLQPVPESGLIYATDKWERGRRKREDCEGGEEKGKKRGREWKVRRREKTVEWVLLPLLVDLTPFYSILICSIYFSDVWFSQIRNKNRYCALAPPS
jgi:hypothetical protein